MTTDALRAAELMKLADVMAEANVLLYKTDGSYAAEAAYIKARDDLKDALAHPPEGAQTSRELLQTFTDWARQVAGREDVPRGIRSAAAALHDDGKRCLAERAQEEME